METNGQPSWRLDPWTFGYCGRRCGGHPQPKLLFICRSVFSRGRFFGSEGKHYSKQTHHLEGPNLQPDTPNWPIGCGSKLSRRGKPQVLVHVSTYQGNPFWNSGFFEPHPMQTTRPFSGGDPSPPSVPQLWAAPSAAGLRPPLSHPGRP